MTSATKLSPMWWRGKRSRSTSTTLRLRRVLLDEPRQARSGGPTANDDEVGLRASTHGRPLIMRGDHRNTPAPGMRRIGIEARPTSRARPRACARPARPPSLFHPHDPGAVGNGVERRQLAELEPRAPRVHGREPSSSAKVQWRPRFTPSRPTYAAIRASSCGAESASDAPSRTPRALGRTERTRRCRRRCRARCASTSIRAVRATCARSLAARPCARPGARDVHARAAGSVASAARTAATRSRSSASLTRLVTHAVSSPASSPRSSASSRRSRAAASTGPRRARRAKRSSSTVPGEPRLPRRRDQGEVHLRDDAERALRAEEEASQIRQAPGRWAPGPPRGACARPRSAAWCRRRS